MAIFYTDSGSLRDLKVSGSTLMSASTGLALQLKSSGSTLFSVSGSGGEIFNVSDIGSSNALFTISSGSTTIVNVDNTKKVTVSGSHVITGSLAVSGTVNFVGLGSDTQSFQHILSINTGSGVVIARSVDTLPNISYYGSYYSNVRQTTTAQPTASVSFSAILPDGAGQSLLAQNGVALASNVISVSNTGWYDVVLILNVVTSTPGSESDLIIITEYSTDGGSNYFENNAFSRFRQNITNTNTPVTVNYRLLLPINWKFRFRWYQNSDKLTLGSTEGIAQGIPSALLHIRYLKGL
jgi:hypothetical protein